MIEIISCRTDLVNNITMFELLLERQYLVLQSLIDKVLFLIDLAFRRRNTIGSVVYGLGGIGKRLMLHWQTLDVDVVLLISNFAYHLRAQAI